MMKSMLLALLLIVSLISAGCVAGAPPGSNPANQSPPRSSTTVISTPRVQGQNAGSSVVQAMIKNHNDRRVSVVCSQCGNTVIRNYTSDQTYICPRCGSAFTSPLSIALVRDAIPFIPLSRIIRGLQDQGVQTTIHETIEVVPDGQDTWFGTSVYRYTFTDGTTILVWATNDTTHCSINGSEQELHGQPFFEYAERVEYFTDRPPRYTSTVPVVTGIGSGSRRNTIIYVPVRDFVEPFGFRVRVDAERIVVET